MQSILISKKINITKLFHTNICKLSFSNNNKFVLKEEDNTLDDLDYEYLNKLSLRIENKDQLIKLLITENRKLTDKNSRLNYRIEHLLKTVNNLENIEKKS